MSEIRKVWELVWLKERPCNITKPSVEIKEITAFVQERGRATALVFCPGLDKSMCAY